MINVTSLLKYNNSKEFKEILSKSMKDIDFSYKEIKLIQSPYNHTSFELSGLSGTTFDFLARIRIAKKIKYKEVLNVIRIPSNVIKDLKENGVDNYLNSENDINIDWLINRFDYIVDTITKYILEDYDIRSEIIQIGFDLACIESLYRSNKRNNFLYTAITPVFKKDMINMLKSFSKEFIESDKILKSNSEVIFNPCFGTSLTNIKADGDIIIDNCLFDLKSRKRLDIKSDIEQLIIYSTLNKVNSDYIDRFGLNSIKTFNIDKIASYNPRFEGVFSVDIKDINQEGKELLMEYISEKKWVEDMR